MNDRSIKLVTLNLWRFYDWKDRFSAIIRLLKELDPDIIFLQEVQRDVSFDVRDQAAILNEHLSFPHSFFAKACVKTTQRGLPLANPIDHGLAVLSKFPFTSEIVQLTRTADDKEQRILMKCDFEIAGKRYMATNIHFSNSDTWADAHLREAFKILENNKTIMAGDFNIKDLKKARDLYSREYVSSSDEFDYISYPNDGFSYDYILIPKEYSFIDFQCRPEAVSDHKLLFATIQLK